MFQGHLASSENWQGTALQDETQYLRDVMLLFSAWTCIIDFRPAFDFFLSNRPGARPILTSFPSSFRGGGDSGLELFIGLAVCIETYSNPFQYSRA